MRIVVLGGDGYLGWPTAMMFAAAGHEVLADDKRVGDRLGLGVKVKNIPNPRMEKEQHYYNAHYTALLELGLQPHYMTDDVLAAMLEKVIKYKSQIEARKILPRVSWNKSAKS